MCGLKESVLAMEGRRVSTDDDDDIACPEVFPQILNGKQEVD